MSAPIAADHVRRWSDHVVQLEFPSQTLPPYASTWITIIHDHSEAFIVDPGFSQPAAADTLAAYLDFLRIKTVVGVLITHAHRDHIDGLSYAQQGVASGAFVGGHPDALTQVAHGPNRRHLNHDDRIAIGEIAVTALYTPGHAEGHLCFALPDGGMIGGDLVTGSGPSYIGVPGGNAVAYEDSLRMVAERKPVWLAVSHGPAIRDPSAAIKRALEHRGRREMQLRVATQQPQPLGALVDILYPTVALDARLYLERSALGYLEKLMTEGAVVNLGGGEDGPYQAVPSA